MTAEQPRDIAAWRKEYEDHGLVESDLGDDPIAAFSTWLDAAQLAGLHEPNAMVVSTVDSSGAPSSRMVLLKTVDARGFVFYTNYHSRKAADLQINDRCSLLFPWHPLERQIRIEGTAHQVDASESDSYFATRPRGAQIGAWASPQSEVVTSREFLAERYIQESDRLGAVDVIPRPSHWGGYLVRPHRIEFWQGRPGRMHDRIRFDRADETAWVVERLAP
jgi:pyridoxamine 5'-phosphate oxidase